MTHAEWHEASCGREWDFAHASVSHTFVPASCPHEAGPAAALRSDIRREDLFAWRASDRGGDHAVASCTVPAKHAWAVQNCSRWATLMANDPDLCRSHPGEMLSRDAANPCHRRVPGALRRIASAGASGLRLRSKDTGGSVLVPAIFAELRHTPAHGACSLGCCPAPSSDPPLFARDARLSPLDHVMLASPCLGSPKHWSLRSMPSVCDDDVHR